MPLSTEGLNLRLPKGYLRFILIILASLTLLRIFVIIRSYYIQSSLNEELEEYICTVTDPKDGNVRPWMSIKRMQKDIQLDKSNIFTLDGFTLRKPVTLKLKKYYFVVSYYGAQKSENLSSYHLPKSLDLIEETPTRLIFGGYVIPRYNFFLLNKPSMNIFRARSSYDAVGAMQDRKEWAFFGKCEIKKPITHSSIKGFKDRLIHLSKTRIKIINISE